MVPYLDKRTLLSKLSKHTRNLFYIDHIEKARRIRKPNLCSNTSNLKKFLIRKRYMNKNKDDKEKKE